MGFGKHDRAMKADLARDVSASYGLRFQALLKSCYGFPKGVCGKTVGCTICL